MTAISVSNSLTLWPGEHKEQQWLTTPAAHALEHDVTHDSSWKIWFIAIALWARSATVETKSSVKWCWRAASGQQRVKRRRATIKYNKMEKWAIQWKILVSIGCDMNTQSTCHDRQRTVETAQENAVTRRRRHNIKSNSIAIEKFHYILSTTQFSNFFFVGLHWLYSLSDCCIESILSFSVGFFFFRSSANQIKNEPSTKAGLVARTTSIHSIPESGDNKQRFDCTRDNSAHIQQSNK